MSKSIDNDKSKIDLNNETFSFEKTKDNLEAILSQYNAYIKGTAAANNGVSENINNGESSAIDSPGLGNWLMTLWVSNATDAEKFSESFTEWSNVVQHIMRNNTNLQDEAETIYKNLDNVPELLIKYRGDNGGVTSSDVVVLTKARVACGEFRDNWITAKYYDDVDYDPTGFINYLGEASDEEKVTVCQKFTKYAKNVVGYHYQYGGTGAPSFDSCDPVTRMVGQYYLKYGEYPSEEVAVQFMDEVAKHLDKKNTTR